MLGFGVVIFTILLASKDLHMRGEVVRGAIAIAWSSDDLDSAQWVPLRLSTDLLRQTVD